jgi:hypothetical protein
MKNPTPPANAPEEEQATSEPESTQGRTGEGAHSAMHHLKHWLQEKERKRSERPVGDGAH